VLWAIFLHANVRFRFPRLGRFIATPQFHHWHHSNDLEARNKNFAGFFPWVDRLFGTYHQPHERWPQTYGVDDAVPDGYLKQQLFPFKNEARRAPS
jgi:sterol desaturase/sphingolipid hydroxylase (fatty acid hydroxylase superfamily)